MPVLQTTDIPDLIESATEDLGRFKLVNHMSTLTKYHAFNRLMKESQVNSEGGTRIRVNLIDAYQQNSRFRGYYATDGEIDQQQGLSHGFVDFRSADFNWAWDEEEIDVNTGAEQIHDYVKVKRDMAIMGWANFIEDWWWGAVPDPADTVTPFNLRYWLTKSHTDVTGGFNGGAASGYSVKGPFSPTTHTTWKNWTYKYTDMTEEDFVMKFRRMIRKIDFQPPTGISISSPVTGKRFEHFMNEVTINNMERLGERRNENLGYDLEQRTITLARASTVYAPKLDDDSDNPIYSIDWGGFKTVLKRNKWMKERKAMQAPRQHTVWVVWVDSRFQIVLYDPRCCAVGSTGVANA